jgi:hypothetical protein
VLEIDVALDSPGISQPAPPTLKSHRVRRLSVSTASAFAGCFENVWIEQLLKLRLLVPVPFTKRFQPTIAKFTSDFAKEHYHKGRLVQPHEFHALMSNVLPLGDYCGSGHSEQWLNYRQLWRGPE